MSNTNETIADILREMREAAKSTDLFNGEEVGEPMIRGTEVEDWADRIDAAAKREREEVESDALSVGGLVEATRHKAGNAAAMREALESTEELLEHFAKPGTMLGDAFAFHMRDNRAALAAPARNCDILSEEAANEAWDEYRHSHVLPRGGWDFRHVIALLYAPAEGGAE